MCLWKVYFVIIEDNSINEAEMNRINFEALEEISGEYGALKEL